MRTLFRRIAYVLANRLAVIVQSAQRADLLRALKSCGTDVFLYMPLRIDDAWNVELGDDVAIAPYVHMWGGGGIRIGNRVMIGAHTQIASQGHDLYRKQMYGTLVEKPVVIEDDVDVGTHCVILPGVTVGKGAVLGAGSVVTSDVKPYTMVVTGRQRQEYRRPLIGERREEREERPARLSV